MKEGVNKRGLSPVIASVLLILLVLVLASIVFLWARGFVGEQIEKFGQPIENSCENVKFEVARFDDAGFSELEVLNYGDIDIGHLEIRMTKDGDAVTRRFDFSIDAGEVVKKDASLVMPDGDTVPDKIIVYPALVGNVVGDTSTNNIFACMNSGVTL